jgi:hypothetical protein
MEMVNTVVNAAVVAAVGLLLAWLAKGRFDAIHKQFEAIQRQFEAIQKQFEAIGPRIDGLQASVDGMRSDLTHVALAVGARPRAENA